MSGKHAKQVPWRPRRLAPLLTLLAGFGTWVALAAALVLLPATSPADVQGTLGGSAQDGGDRDEPGGPPAVPPQTLSTGPTTPADATPSEERTRPGRDAAGTTDPTTTATTDPATTDPTTDPTSDPTTAPGPSQTSPPGQANGHDDDHPGKGPGPHGKP